MPNPKPNCSILIYQSPLKSLFVPRTVWRSTFSSVNELFVIKVSKISQCALVVSIWMEAQQLTHVTLSPCLCSGSERGKAARCCGRCADSCCSSWLPSCPAHAAPTCQMTVIWKRRADQGTLASGKSMWWRPALCSDSTVPSWALQASGKPKRIK